MTIAAIPFTESFTADPDHSSFQAQLRHMGVGSFRTSFADVEARLETGPDGARLTGRARVDSITITRPPEFRAHVVEGEDFFDGRNHPYLSFESRRLEFSADGTVRVDGLLTMRGTERPIAASGTYLGPVEESITADAPLCTSRPRSIAESGAYSFQATLRRGGDVLSWTVRLSIDLELVAD